MVAFFKQYIGRLIVVALVLLVSGCSSKDGGPAGTESINPSAFYKGAQTQAQVTQDNAADLAIGGFSGGNINSNIRAKSVGSTVTSAQTEPTHFLRQMANGLKRSLRFMDIVKTAEQIRKVQQNADSKKMTPRIESNTVSGPNGGSASYTIDINDATGSFTGSITYQSYQDGQVTLDGTANINGTFDSNYQAISLVTISFEGLSLKIDTLAITMSGNITWSFNFSASAETMTVDTVLTDQSNDKTFWFNNYIVTTTYGSASFTQTYSGRYYDPTYGFVNITTLTPLVTAYGNSWPNQGSLRFYGSNGTSVILTFYPRKLTVEADTTGGGTITWQNEYPTNSQQDINAQPVADAGPDQNGVQMELVFLDGTDSYDADGDPLSYSWSFSSCPQGTCPGLTGANTSTPSFEPRVPGTYTLRLTVFDGLTASPSDSVSVFVAAATPSNQSLLRQQWQYGVFGSYIGKAGLLTSDLNGDGTLEIITSASGGGFGDNSFWYILNRNAAGAYDQIWRSEMYPVSLVRLTMADCNSDGKDELIAALADGTIYVYDRTTRQKIRTYTAASPLTDLAIADIDGDSTLELVTSNGTCVYVYSAGSGTLKWSLSAGGGSSVAVGNVDADSAQEIVTTTYGGKGYVIDGVTHTVEWEYINSFGARVRLGDLDGDGMQEIIGASAWYKITIFDADLKTPTWEITTPQDIGAVIIADTDDDGIPEIIYGDGQWGKVQAINVRSHTVKWAVTNPEHGVSGIAMADVDMNGKKEVLWGAGGTSTGPDYLYVASTDTGTIAWQNQDVFGMNPVALGDLDADGRDEIIMVTQDSESGYEEGVVHIFDARTHVLKFSQKLGIQDWMGEARTVRIGDVDGDSKVEYVITTAYLYDGFIQVYDGTTHTLKCQSARYNGTFFSALAIGDVDGDGAVEIVAGQGREHTGAAGVYLVVFDGSTLQEKWRSTDLGVYWGSVFDIKLADVDGDGHREIISTVADNRLLVYDGITHVLKQIITHPARSLEVADIDSDGDIEVLVGRNDGIIDVFNGKTFAVKQSVSSYSVAAVSALRMEDLDGDGKAEWMIGSGSDLIILDGVTRRLKWRSVGLSNNIGFRNHLAVKDVDGNGHKDVVFGSDLALYHYE